MDKQTKENNNSLFYAGKGIARMSLGLNIILTSVQFILYFFTKSAALLAEAVHSLTEKQQKQLHLISLPFLLQALSILQLLISSQN